MDKNIICSIQPFILKQTINVYDPETKSVNVFYESDMQHLSENLYKAALTANANAIQIYGEQNYISKIAKELKEKNSNNTYNKKVRIYLNGKVCD